MEFSSALNVNSFICNNNTKEKTDPHRIMQGEAQGSCRKRILFRKENENEKTSNFERCNSIPARTDKS